ncbi:MAG: FAD-dependent oxidoreductase [Alphaproteobacteria bacterium]
MAESVVVIGAGIVGMACAGYLQRDGHAVTVVDRVAPGEGCSFGNAGGMSPGSVVPLSMPGTSAQVMKWLFDPLGPLSLRPSYLPRLIPWLLRFKRAGSPERVEQISIALRALHEDLFECYDPLIRAAKAEDLIVRDGQMYVYQSEESFRQDAAGRDLRRARGVVVEELDSDQIREREPALAPIFERAAFFPEHGHCRDPHALVRRLAEQFQRAGGTILRRHVNGFEIGPDGPTRLHADGGDIDCSALVIAAGAWSHRLAARLGSKVPLETQRGYHVTVADPGVAPRRIVMWADRKFMATPMEHGLRFAGTAEFAGLDAPPDYRRARALLDHGRIMYPGLKDEHVSEWMGHRPCLPDSLPVIGRSPRFPAVHYAFGHGHTGLTGASMTGQFIADLVAGRPPVIDVAPFRVDRF